MEFLIKKHSELCELCASAVNPAFLLWFQPRWSQM
jgi:hypothetical protein